MSVKGTTIDRADYALLNAVSLDEWAAYLLAGDAPMEAIMNVPSHGLSPQDLAEHFFKLWRDGLIECLNDSVELSGPVLTPDFNLARQQFLRDEDWPPRGTRALIYRLTEDGGRVWERLSSPNWQKFFSTGAGSQPGEWRLESSDRILVDSLFRCRGYHPPALAGTEFWTILQPWSATYWKRLPIGHRLTFRFETYDWPPQTCPVAPNETDARQQVWESAAQWRKSFDEVCKEHFQ